VFGEQQESDSNSDNFTFCFFCVSPSFSAYTVILNIPVSPDTNSFISTSDKYLPKISSGIEIVFSF